MDVSSIKDRKPRSKKQSSNSNEEPNIGASEEIVSRDSLKKKSVSSMEIKNRSKNCLVSISALLILLLCCTAYLYSVERQLSGQLESCKRDFQKFHLGKDVDYQIDETREAYATLLSNNEYFKATAVWVCPFGRII